MPAGLAFEDFRPGDVAEYGDLVVDRADMLDFAREFDPQPMHVSEEAARGSMLGELIASGWYTAALLMRMNCDEFLLDARSLGSPGVDSLEWRAPVRAGDRLTVRREVLSARRVPGRPEAGLVKFRFDVVNQDGAVVMRQVSQKLIGRRAEAA
ncbi:MaoC family dehydratase [Hansschlegelia zhihuaiae]|uniref:MaoC family dehydratase n=1 Tax=Hansschlegelia zhihuaiae TaxID=405005 RepID=A0A4Q0MJB5_9HYPH|nr:MaoC family dehydratase [Hansschlegelia zhihuaiae]RXF73535.1 MaoC family dehydratase [Hansschlegelia zhihuaiae]